MISFNVYTALITLALLGPVVGSIALFSILAFEREIDVLKHENVKVRLEKELKQSEYMQLNQQIHPHFLFNTMNLILGLARLKKNEQLIEVLEHLSLFLKFKYREKEQLISFSDELEYTKHYLSIQQIRMGSRLTIFYELAPSSNVAVFIPPYMLQTLTENAFKHSLEKKSGMIELHIRFRTDETTATLEVIDNGIGVIDDDFDIDQTSGHGLKNIKKRLSLLFGHQASIHLEQVPTGGVKVIASWPIKKEF
ncbi:sensor histidine kinase [Neobacillus sp. D3-1R]|uniref:sensor histidine kinase n=1 Tax=Neobacillus sp. D3-1R TaxID=3445778 RepID=UPI003FA173B6